MGQPGLHLKCLKNGAKGRYEILLGDRVVGLAEFRPVRDAVMPPHTEVDEGHEGKAPGSQRARFALDDASSAGQRVTPMCPFSAGNIRRHPEYVALVHPQQRGVFQL